MFDVVFLGTAASTPSIDRGLSSLLVRAGRERFLVDCGEGRERNPETNRCRNVKRTAPPPASFAVEPVKEAASVFVGWWVLGAVVAAAVGYAGWEWRDEIGRAVRKVLRAGHSSE